MTVARLLGRKDVVEGIETQRIHANLERHKIELDPGRGSRDRSEHGLGRRPRRRTPARSRVHPHRHRVIAPPAAGHPLRRRGRARRRRHPADRPSAKDAGRDRGRRDRLRIRMHVRGARRRGAPDRSATGAAAVPGRRDGRTTGRGDDRARRSSASRTPARPRRASQRRARHNPNLGRGDRGRHRADRLRPQREHPWPRSRRGRRRGRPTRLRRRRRGLPDGGAEHLRRR